MFSLLPASRFLAVDLGASHTACAWFRVGADDSVALRDFAIERFNPDPTEDARWLDRAGEALRACLRGRRASGVCAVALPPHLTLTKSLRVPAVPGANRPKLIAFEVQQQLSYSLSDAVWDYGVGGDDGHELEILLTAARSDLLEAVCRMLAGAGLRPELLLPSPLALLGAPASSSEAPVLRVDIGARTTVLAIREGGRDTVRAAAVAGNTFTQAIAEALTLSFGAAEAVKRRTLGDDPGDPSEPTVRAAVEHAVEAFVTQLHGEIVRTRLDHRRRGGGDPHSAWLSGAGSRVRDLDTRLARKTGLRVERRLEPAPGAGSLMRRSAEPALGELLPILQGLVVAARPGAVRPLNLLPPAIARQEAFRRRQPWLIAAAAFAALGVLSPLIHYTRFAQTTALHIARVEQEIRRVAEDRERTGALTAQLADWRREMATIRDVEAGRSYWVEVLDAVHATIAADGSAWIDRLQLASVSGAAPAPRAAAATPQWFGSPIKPVPGPESPLKVRLGGFLIDLAHPRSESATALRARVTSLLERLRSTPVVTTIESEHFDLTEPGLLRFEVVLTLRPNRAPAVDNSILSHD